jgi:hypothetical protein
MPTAPNDPKTTTEPFFTPEELSTFTKLHVTTIRRMFLDEPGVIRLGHGPLRKKRQHYTLRIPQSVADRVFGRMTVGGGNANA